VAQCLAVAALALIAIDRPDIPNENAASCDRQRSPSWSEPPQADFPVPFSVREMDAGSLAIGGDCSPFEGGEFDIDHDIEQVRQLLDELTNEEIDDMIDLPEDRLITTFTSSDQEEQFQNGFGVNIVSQGRYFQPVVHTRRRNVAFHASNVWSGPTPAFHGLPYSYAHQRRGRHHHFAEVFISTSIVAHELGYQEPMQYVEARGWTFSSTCKLHYWQIKEIIFQKAPGKSPDLQVGFHSMVGSLYKMIENDGMKDPYTGKPAVNFLDKNSFTQQKLHQHAQEFQMALIIVKEFFLEHVNHHKGNIEYWLKEIFQSCQRCKNLLRFFNNVFLLFPDGDDPKLAKELLQHPNAMRDKASSMANDNERKIRYSDMVECSLATLQ
jgi:hypothetical protein